MADDAPRVAHGEAFRRRGALEALGERMRGAVPQGGVRRWLRSAYHAALSLRGAGRGIAAQLPGGETVRLLPEYRFVTWNTAEYRAFRAAAAPGAVALDVGANVGAYALVMGQWVRPGGRVFAFEPAPGTFAGLARHVALNGLGGVVTPVRAAASDRTGTASFSVDGASGANRLGGGDDAGAAERVDTVTLDDFCARERISPALIKIDVEGAELAVLRGARETLRRCGRGLEVFVEMHPTLWRESGMTAADVQAELAAQGLCAVPLTPADDPWALEGECLRLVRA